MRTTDQTNSAVASAERRGQQTLSALQLDDALLRVSTVEQATGLSVATIYRKLKGDFPQPVRLGSLLGGPAEGRRVARHTDGPEAARRGAGRRH
ncbi:helix-turn-helix transcriptional regulator [Roseateles sp.]|uniref:helix-turn-helix transcriptional regulator n=1 Tax=Roseateles sp. TaxID=1971397 RepID=UPI003BA87433